LHEIERYRNSHRSSLRSLRLFCSLLRLEWHFQRAPIS